MIKTLFAALQIFFYMILKYFNLKFIEIFQKKKLTNKFFINAIHDFSNYVLKKTQTKLVVEGEENLNRIDKGRSIVVMSNHESYLDIPIIMNIMPFKIGFIAKKELGRIPILSFWIKKIGGLLIDRKNFKSALKTLDNAVKKLSDQALLIFPEGTRNKNNTVSPFKSGSFKLAFRSESVILPVCVYGGRNKFEANNYRLQKGKVCIRILPPKDCKDLNKKEKETIVNQTFNEILSSHNSLKKLI